MGTLAARTPVAVGIIDVHGEAQEDVTVAVRGPSPSTALATLYTDRTRATTTPNPTTTDATGELSVFADEPGDYTATITVSRGGFTETFTRGLTLYPDPKDVEGGAANVVDVKGKYGLVVNSAATADRQANTAAFLAAIAAEPAGSEFVLPACDDLWFEHTATNGVVFDFVLDAVVSCQWRATTVHVVPAGAAAGGADPTGSFTAFKAEAGVDLTFRRVHWVPGATNANSVVQLGVLHAQGTGALRLLDGSNCDGWNQSIKVDGQTTSVASSVLVETVDSFVTSNITYNPASPHNNGGGSGHSALGNCLLHFGGKVLSRNTVWNQKINGVAVLADAAMPLSDYHLCHLFYLHFDVEVDCAGDTYQDSGGVALSWNGGPGQAARRVAWTDCIATGAVKDNGGVLLTNPYGRTKIERFVFAGSGTGKSVSVSGDLDAIDCDVWAPDAPVQNYGTKWGAAVRWRGGTIGSRIVCSGGVASDWLFEGVTVRSLNTSGSAPSVVVSAGTLTMNDSVIDGGPAQQVQVSKSGTFHYNNLEWRNVTNEVQQIAVVNATGGTFRLSYQGVAATLADGTTTSGSDIVTSATFSRRMNGQPVADQAGNIPADSFLSGIDLTVTPHTALLVDSLGNQVLATGTANPDPITILGPSVTPDIAYAPGVAPTQERLRAYLATLPTMAAGSIALDVVGPAGGPWLVLFTDLFANATTNLIAKDAATALVGGGADVTVSRAVTGGATVLAVDARDFSVIDGGQGSILATTGALQRLGSSTGTQRLKRGVNPTVLTPSAGVLTVTSTYDQVQVGAGAITTVYVGNAAATNLYVGAALTLVWTAAGTLAAGGNVTAQNKATHQAGEATTLVYDGTAWREVTRALAGLSVSIVPVAGAAVLDLSGDDFDVLLNAAVVTLTLTNPPASGDPRAWTVRFRQDGFGGRTVVFSPAVKRPGGSAYVPTATASAADEGVLFTRDGGATYELRGVDLDVK